MCLNPIFQEMVIIKDLSAGSLKKQYFQAVDVKQIPPDLITVLDDASDIVSPKSRS